MLKRTRGFTLIEVMIVVAIIAIIAAVAIPSYSSHVERTRRANAQSDLMELAQWMERRYSSSFDYRDAGNPPALPFTTSPQGGGTAYYNLSFQGAVGQNAYLLQAVPVVGSPQENDPCGTMTVDNVGATGAAENWCW